MTGLSAYHSGESEPFQELPLCDKPLESVTNSWSDYDLSLLVAHDDFNFDGYQDLELLTAYVPHLGKKLYCIYLWDNDAARFRYSRQLSDIAASLKADPKNKALIEEEDWQGGAWQRSIYRWQGAKLELISQTSLLGDWSQQTDKECGFAFTCSRLINGKMVVTFGKNICTDQEMENLPDCPSAAVSRPEPAVIPERSGVPNPPNVTSFPQ